VTLAIAAPSDGYTSAEPNKSHLFVSLRPEVKIQVFKESMLLADDMDIKSRQQWEAVRALIIGERGFLCCMYESIAKLAEEVSAHTPEFHRRKGNNDNISDRDLNT